MKQNDSSSSKNTVASSKSVDKSNRGTSDRSYVWIYVCTLVAGVLLAVFHSQVKLLTTILIALGAIFAISGLWGLITVWQRHSKGKSTPASTWVIFTAVASVIFGALLIFMPAFFIQYLIYTFGIMLLVFAIMQIANLWSLIKDGKQRLWYMIVPVLTICAGIWLLCMNAHEMESLANLVTGIAFIVWSANGLFGYVNRGLKAEEKSDTVDEGSSKTSKEEHK